MIPAPEYDTCLDCGRPLHTVTSRRRGRGVVCQARYAAAHPWLSWHRSPPRLGHVPDGPMEGQDVLFPVQMTIPAAPAVPARDTESTNDNQE